MQLNISPDKNKAQSLVEMAKITLQRLKETDEEKYPSNTLTDYYDCIHKIMEALAFLEGIKIKGEGSHQELIDYTCGKYQFEESIRIFTQEIRNNRNRISYEGFMVHSNYIKNNMKRIEFIITRLIEIFNSKN